MKILHSINSIDFRSGGPVRAVLDLATVMAERGHTVRAITQSDPDAPASWKQEGGNPRSVVLGRAGMKGMRFTGQALETMRREIRDADVVHIHGVWTPYMTQVAAEARRAGKPYVLSPRGMLDDWSMDQKRLKKLVYLRVAGGSRMLNEATAIHCTAEGELRQSQKWFPGSRGVVIPNLLNLDPYRTPPGPEAARSKFPHFDSGEPVLLFLSRLHYKKGVEHLIRAAAMLRDRGLPHRVLVAGAGDDGYEASLKALAKELRLEDRVAFLGMVVGDLKVSLYQAADLFVLPTSQENFGFVLYEAMAAGTPLVTTRGVDTWPELEEAGGVITDQDATQIADAIAGLTARREDLPARGAKGRAWVFENLENGRVASQFEAMYADAAGRGR